MSTSIYLSLSHSIGFQKAPRGVWRYVGCGDKMNDVMFSILRKPWTCSTKADTLLHCTVTKAGAETGAQHCESVDCFCELYLGPQRREPVTWEHKRQEKGQLNTCEGTASCFGNSAWQKQRVLGGWDSEADSQVGPGSQLYPCVSCEGAWCFSCRQLDTSSDGKKGT